MIEALISLVVVPMYWTLDRAPWLIVVVVIAAVVAMRRLGRWSLVAPLLGVVACAGVVHRRPGGAFWEASVSRPEPCAVVLGQPGVSPLYTAAEGAPDPAEAKLYDLAWNAARRELLATYWSDERPRAIDVEARTARVVAWPVDGGAIEMTASDASGAYVTANCGMAAEPCRSGWRYDFASGTVAPVSVPLRRAAHVAIDAATGRQWWAEDGHAGVAVTGDREARLSVGSAAWKLDVDPARRRVFVADFFLGGRLHAIDADTFTEVASVRVAPVLTDVAIDSARGRVYVARPFGSRLSVLDADTLADAGALPAPFGVRELDVEPESGRIVAGSFFAARAMVVSTHGAIVREIRTGGPVRGVRWMGAHAVALADSACGVIRLDV